eukprot:s3479_g12.t1
MADLMAGPGAPFTRAFISCGWRCITVDWLLDSSHDLANPARQASLSAQLEEVIFTAAAPAQCVVTDNQACNYVLQEIHKLSQRGGGSARQNLARSLHWRSTAEVRLWESGDWMETAYAACTLGGARCKQQLLRHNIEEIKQWPVAACHHIHDPEEWTPYTSEGRRVYPSKEEAEYTATLAYMPLLCHPAGGLFAVA